MTESVHKETEEVPSGRARDGSADIDALLASLRAAGAERFASVRWHYLVSLAERAGAYGGNVKRMLEAKLVHALEAFKQQFEQAQIQANGIVLQGTQRYPYAAADLQRLYGAGDFKEVQRLIARLKAGEHCASLRTLTEQLAQHALENAAAHPQQIAAPRAELKILRNSRSTWSKLSADKQVAQAFAQAPKNAGPINSHMLVLRSLALMRDISPDYLNRFISYADTLVCLEQGEKEKADRPKKRPVKATKTKNPSD